MSLPSYSPHVHLTRFILSASWMTGHTFLSLPLLSIYPRAKDHTHTLSLSSYHSHPPLFVCDGSLIIRTRHLHNHLTLYTTSISHLTSHSLQSSLVQSSPSNPLSSTSSLPTLPKTFTKRREMPIIEQEERKPNHLSSIFLDLEVRERTIQYACILRTR